MMRGVKCNLVLDPQTALTLFRLLLQKQADLEFIGGLSGLFVYTSRVKFLH